MLRSCLIKEENSSVNGIAIFAEKHLNSFVFTVSGFCLKGYSNKLLGSLLLLFDGAHDMLCPLKVGQTGF